MDIEFLDGERAGLHDNVPGTRMHGSWSSVAAYDERMANWQRLATTDLDETEESAVGDVFDLLIPETVATYYDSFVRNGATGAGPSSLGGADTSSPQRRSGAGRVV